MLGDPQAVATVAVKDLAAAKRFYADTLGLTQVAADGDEAVTYATGTSKLMVYRSQYAGSNKSTAVTWLVGDDIEQLTEALKKKGVVFEYYDMPGMTRTGELHAAMGTRAAWFKDPDGNIHGIVSRSR